MSFPVAVLLVLSLGLVSCKKDPVGDKPKTPSITSSQTSVGSGKTELTISVTAVGAWTIHVEYPSGTDSWLKAKTPESGSGNGMVMYEAAANTGEEARKAHVIVTADNGSDFVELTQAAPGGDTPSGEAGKWLELPETPEGKGCYFGAHDMNGDPYVSEAHNGVRNWSCWWNPSEHVSIWVAYPLNNSLKGSGGRTEAWGLYDPCFLEDNQPNCSFTYGGGWTRGHQIPSADRLKYNGSTKCNESTYYPTNMTPQGYNFNAGIWASLEGKVRGYAAPAKSDTLYVVTGCVINPNSGYSGRNTGFNVTVPSAYWKALLSYKNSRNSVNGGFIGCAFYLEHKEEIASDNPLSDKYMMSIDALEKKIGIDLFVNLPDKIGADRAAAIESAVPDSFWK